MYSINRKISLAVVACAAALWAAPAASEAQSGWGWRPEHYRTNTPRTTHFTTRVPVAPVVVPVVPPWGGVQWHNAPTYHYWTGPGYHYVWRNPGASVYYGPGYYYQYYW